MTTTHDSGEVVRSLKADLLRPQAYPQSTNPKKIELRETHISWVFLLDRDVYKVKKPVNLGFLDFRTIEQRRVACEAENRLNRRLAPDVYVDVVPVCRGPLGYAQIGGSGPVIDWAVHMVRLLDETRADNLLGAGTLTPATLDRIAQGIAAFHAESRFDADTAVFGSPAMLEKNVLENFEQTRPFLDKYLRPDEAEEVRRWQLAFLRGHGSIFEQRATEGHVRDGHGDLRLEHCYVEDGKVTVIDCIEFNDRFRFADVCSDIAFLSMDLTSSGRVDLAERLLATYARAADDFDLYAVVDFYESYRAFVRGKISSMLAEDRGLDESVRHRAAEQARRYFLLALSSDRSSLLLPAVVAVGGVIASGKSTIAKRIGADMSAPVIDADRTRKAMLNVPATRRLDDEAWSGAYDPKITDAVYREILRRAAVVLESGRPVVLDASFHSKAMRSAVRELAVSHSVPLRFVECRAPADVCRARLVEREELGGVSDGRLAIFDAFCARFEPVRELCATEHFALDTTLSVEQNITKLHASIDTWPHAFVT